MNKFSATHEDHLQLFHDQNQVWNFKFGNCSRFTNDWRMELITAAYQIAAQASNIRLYADGSFASEMMIQAFQWARLPVRVVVPRFEKDLNIHSISQSVLLLESLKVPYDFCDLNLEAFLNSETSKQWARKYCTDRVEQLVAMQVWRHEASKKHHMVFPFGMFHFEKQPEAWKICEFEREYGVWQFQKDLKLPGVPLFFKWNPEMMMAFLLDRSVRDLVTNLKGVDKAYTSIWREICQSYFKMISQFDWKGFEKCETQVKRFIQDLISDKPQLTAVRAVPYVDLVAQLKMTPTPLKKVGG